MLFGSNLKQVTGLALLILLSGCNTVAVNHSRPLSSELYEQPAPAAATPLDQLLNSAAPQRTALLADSPWGQQLEISTDAPYYAASGLTCRQLSVGVAQQKALACRQPDGRWAPSRLFN